MAVDKKNGGPAFPVAVWSGDRMMYVDNGMTLRDYFAAKALTGVLYMVAHGAHDVASSAEGCAIEAYKLADAMLTERAK